MKKRYPLDPVRVMKQREQEAAVRSLGESTRRRVAAVRSELSLAERGRASEARRREIMVAEESRASRGKVRADDLARLEAFRRHGEALAKEQSIAERAAARATASAVDEEGRRREHLSRAEGERRVIEEHHARHRTSESARALRGEDEDASDGHAARDLRKKARRT